MNFTNDTDAIENEIQQALSLAKAGEKEQALQILIGVVRRDPDQARAWMIMAKLVPDRQKAIHCLQQVLRIEPGNATAAEYLAKIEGREPITAPPPKGPVVEMVPIVPVTPVFTPTPPSAPTQTYDSVPTFTPALYEIPMEAPAAQPRPQQDNSSSMLIMAGLGIIAIGLCVGGALVLRQVVRGGAAAPGEASPQLDGGSEAGDASDGSGILNINPLALPTADQGGATGGGVTVASQPNVTYDTKFYTIKGETVDQVRVDLQTKGPMHINGRDALAMAQIGYEVHWQQLTSGDDCSLIDVNVDVSITYTYPDWQPEGYVAANLLPEWDRFMVHVREHEQHHGDLGVQCATEMLSEMRGVLKGVACGEAEPVIDSYLDNKMLDCQAKQDAFDAIDGTTTFPLP